MSRPTPTAQGRPQPREAGLTMVLDRLYGLVEVEFEQAARYVDIVEIGWGLPLVWRDEAIASRVAYYRGQGIDVSMSGTLLEYFAFQNDSRSILEKARRLGFSMVEVSDGIIDLTQQQKGALVKQVKSYGMKHLIAVGKKNPAAQLSVAETCSQIEGALATDPVKVVLEGRERGRGVGIYDEQGEIRWGMLRSISSRFDHRQIIFEAPSEMQQIALISELGPDVNLGNVSFGSIAALQSERLGLRFDTFGVDRPGGEGVKGGPSVKFVLFVVQNFQPVDQREIASITQLPSRTIQKAIEYLKENRYVTEHPNFEDRRSKIYRTPRANPIRRGGQR